MANKSSNKSRHPNTGQSSNRQSHYNKNNCSSGYQQIQKQFHGTSLAQSQENDKGRYYQPSKNERFGHHLPHYKTPFIQNEHPYSGGHYKKRKEKQAIATQQQHMRWHQLYEQ